MDHFDTVIGLLIVKYEEALAKRDYHLARRIKNMLSWAFDAENKFSGLE